MVMAIEIADLWRALVTPFVRCAMPADQPFLRAMRHEAAGAAASVGALPAGKALARAALARYRAGWGRAGDTGVVALVNGERAGAAWYRLFPESERGAGVMAQPGLPELAIGVRPGLRGRGV